MLFESAAQIAGALARIADAFEWHCKIESERLERDYPAVPERKPATITTAKYPNPLLDQPEKAAENEDLTEGLGPREAALVKARLQKQKYRSPSTPRA